MGEAVLHRGAISWMMIFSFWNVDVISILYNTSSSLHTSAQTFYVNLGTFELSFKFFVNNLWLQTCWLRFSQASSPLHVGILEKRCKWNVLKIRNRGLYLLHIRTYFLSGSSWCLWRTLSDRKWIIVNYWFTKNKVKVSLWKTLNNFKIWYETTDKWKIKQERKCL